MYVRLQVKAHTYYPSSFKIITSNNDGVTSVIPAFHRECTINSLNYAYLNSQPNWLLIALYLSRCLIVNIRTRSHARTHAQCRTILWLWLYSRWESERMVHRWEVRGRGGCGSGCPTNQLSKVAVDCPPRLIGRVCEPASELAIVLSPGFAVTIHQRSRSYLRFTHLRSITREYPRFDRVARGDAT